jgi:hypothetical protein
MKIEEQNEEEYIDEFQPEDLEDIEQLKKEESNSEEDQIKIQSLNNGKVLYEFRAHFTK